MAGLGLVEQVSENVFSANDITRYMIEYPSAQHGALHLLLPPSPPCLGRVNEYVWLTSTSTTEAIFAGAFLYPKLKSTGFQYPLKEGDGPVQYAHKLMGNEELSKKHTYSIMEEEGRMDSFNEFMVGKFFQTSKMPAHFKALGYDLGAIISETAPGAVAMVDVGGGHGQFLQEIREAYPELGLGPSNMIVQDLYTSVDTLPGLTLMKWNFKDTTPQPVRGACIYSIQHILHNLPDLEAIGLLQKIAAAMTADSRLIVLECTKNLNSVTIHASMIALYGGRERSSAEWKQMAALCGLEVTFEIYPDKGESLVEMRKAGI